MPEQFFAFIRHGEYHQKKDVPSALQPYALNDSGVAQSIEAANIIEQFLLSVNAEIDNIIDSSPLLRAWQTANIIAENLKAPAVIVETFPELVERSVGSVANLSTTEIEQAIEQDSRYQTPPKDWKSNSHYCLPFLGAESLMQAGQRVEAHIQQRLRSHFSQVSTKSELKLFVGHGAAIRHAAYLMGILSFDEIAKTSMYHAKPIFFKVEGSQFQHIAGSWKQRKEISNDSQTPFTD